MDKYKYSELDFLVKDWKNKDLEVDEGYYWISHLFTGISLNGKIRKEDKIRAFKVIEGIINTEERYDVKEINEYQKKYAEEVSNGTNLF